MGGEPHTAGPKQASVALILARLHMDLIGWEIIIPRGKMRGGEELKEVRRGELECNSILSKTTRKIQKTLLNGLFPPFLTAFTHIFSLSSQETYLALVTSSVSVNRKRCLSWVCRPVLSCVWA